ncbi:MAG: DUF3833 family protein [Candidatus Thiodiazotropha endolucinida]
MKALPKVVGPLLLLCLMWGDVNARINPLADYPSLRSVGSGVLIWWGIRVYKATLYAPQGEYHPNMPHALEIVYRMEISREQVAKTSLNQIEKIQGHALVDGVLLNRSVMRKFGFRLGEVLLFFKRRDQ